MGWPRLEALLSLAMLATMNVGAGAEPAVHCPTKECDPARLQRRTLSARRLEGSRPIIDGRLDESAWRTTPAATDFVEGSPRPGAPASLRSEARVLVDDEALYVALSYYDDSPERILAPLARRDDETTSDWAFVEIDSRHDRRTAFSFGVNPRGVQVDGVWMDDDALYDTSWNGVWESAAHVGADGWTAEFRIPLSQLAFSLAGDGRDLVWGINFYRYSPFHGQSSNWSPRFRGLGGIVSNFNELRVPAPPTVRRLDFTPYASPRFGDGGTTAERRWRAGADVRVGLGANFNVTATLTPDFGQVESDPSQVNLTAFELFQPERRPFFLEGLDLFRLDTSLAFTSRGVSFADESPFYSRRIGRAPSGKAPDGSNFVSVPGETTLLGAAKILGQTPGGWSLGVFSAVTARELALARDLSGQSTRWPVEPAALVTIGRAVRTLNHGNSTLGVLAANVRRFGLDPELGDQFVREVDLAGVDAVHRLGGRAYQLRGWILGTRVIGDADAIDRIARSPQHYLQRPDRPGRGWNGGRTNLSGGAGELHVSRVAGSVRWDIATRAISPGFDVNEIGFQRQSDWLLLAGRWQLDRFRPGHLVRAWSVGSDNLGMGWSWSGETRARTANAFVQIDWRNYWSLKVTGGHEWPAWSVERLRGGPAVLLPSRSNLAISLQTDQRRASFATVDATTSREPDSGSWSASIAPVITIRSADWLQWSVGPAFAVDTIGWQPIAAPASGPEGASQGPWLVGRVTERTLSLTARCDVIFSPRLVLQYYAQPFGTIGAYDRYQRFVAAPASDPAAQFVPVTAWRSASGRALLDVDRDGDGRVDGPIGAPDAEARALTSNTVLRWEYRPGSFLTFVWNHRSEVTVADRSRPLTRALGALFRDPATDVILVKASFRMGS